jgi:hypothetical protein
VLQNLRYAKELRSAKKAKGETPEEVSIDKCSVKTVHFNFIL